MRHVLAGLALLGCSASVGAQAFNGGMPAGYTCAGNCSTSTPNGDITPVPSGASRFGYVTTFQTGNHTDPFVIGGTNGSVLASSAFTGLAGQTMSFYFDYITSDGSSFPDYAWVQLRNTTTLSLTTLFTARTNPSGNTVPGFGLPGITAGVTLTPSSVVVTPGLTNFSGLGADSGACWLGPGNGCGNTGWIAASYDFTADDSYQLVFGVSNVNDGGYQSALLFDYDTGEGGAPTISTTPEPASLLLVATGALALGFLRRRRHPARAQRVQGSTIA